MTVTPDGPTNALLGFVPFVLFFVVVGAPFYRIFKRAGCNPWLFLLMIIPIVNVVVLWWFSFARWPAVPISGPEPGIIYTESELQDLRNRRPPH